MKQFSFNQKCVLITGASSGIGEALSQKIASQASHLILVARNVEKLKTLQKKLENQLKVSVYQLDLCDFSAIDDFASELNNQRLSIDVLIHNAGISQRSLAKETSEETELKIWNTNYFGPIRLTKKLLAFMPAKPSKIVVISSIVGVFGYPFRSTYSATKHALKGYFESLALEEKSNGLEVHFVLPGRVRTDISKKALRGDGQHHDKMDEGQAIGISAERCAGDIVKAVNRGKVKVLIGGKELLMVKLYSIFPNVFKNIALKELKNE